MTWNKRLKRRLRFVTIGTGEDGTITAVLRTSRFPRGGLAALFNAPSTVFRRNIAGGTGAWRCVKLDYMSPEMTKDGQHEFKLAFIPAPDLGKLWSCTPGNPDSFRMFQIYPRYGKRGRMLDLLAQLA